MSWLNYTLNKYLGTGFSLAMIIGLIWVVGFAGIEILIARDFCYIA